MDLDFIAFDKIQPIGKLFMRITQKIHGTNAQIYIFPHPVTGEKIIRVGSRNRWLEIDDDNYGFAKFVYDNKDEFLNLGFGRHYGEWAGPGINSEEGLKERTLFLFGSPERYLNIPLPKNVTIIPQLYVGRADMTIIDDCMKRLLEQGSFAVPGFMKPEGIVIEISGQRYKKVFEQEDSPWSEKKERPKREFEDFSHLLQPLRLEKLLSKDEKYIREYPETLPEIAKLYFVDLMEEGQIQGTEEEIAKIRKKASRDVFVFIKTRMKCMENKNAGI